MVNNPFTLKYPIYMLSSLRFLLIIDDFLNLKKKNRYYLYFR